MTHSMDASSSRSRAILAQLNPMQMEAVLHDQGPLVVFAGAGSGKTRIITARIAYLIAQGVAPSQILAVTFTNKAAREMRERVEGLTPEGRLVHIGTFHAACARWLREFASHLGFHPDFTIYDDKEALSVIKQVLTELSLDSDKEAANDYKHAIAKAKVLAWLPADVEREQQSPSNFFPYLGAQVYRRYQEYLAQCNAMDFSDLLLNMLLLLRRDPEVGQRLKKRYRYILVDEYQDTNPTQFHLIASLVDERENLCVVGDDDQSIYSWRGADPSNIIEFKRYYPRAKVVRLEQNYRCSGNIIAAASALIAHNYLRVEKKLWTENAAGELIDYELCYDGQLEALSVVDRLQSEQKRYPWHEVAIFYRTNAQSRLLEEHLRRAAIPYRIYGALRFYDRAEIKDIIAFLRLAINGDDDLALQRVLNIPPRGLGDKAWEEIANWARQEACSALAAIKMMAQVQIPRLSAKLKKWLQEWESFQKAVSSASLSEVLAHFFASFDYRAYIEQKFPDQAADKMANIHELGAALNDYHERYPQVTLSEWLREISLSGSENEENGGVCLMTLHLAKGLEFPRVHIIGMEDGLLPHASSLDEQGELEEERRLFYVGITRAKVKLSLYAAKKRRLYNDWLMNLPSRFLKEIPENLVHTLGGMPSPLLSSQGLATKGASVAAGQFVSHPTFGKGVVESVRAEVGAFKASVKFKDFGRREIAVQHLKQIAFLE